MSARENISNDQQQNDLGTETTNSKLNEWKTFEDSSAGISFLYPSDYYLYNTSISATLFLDLYKFFSINYFPFHKLSPENITLVNKNLGFKIPNNGSFDSYSINQYALSCIDSTLKNNSNFLLVENITTDKWKVDQQNATSYMISIPEYLDSDYIRTENILFTNPQKDRLYSATFSAPSSQFDTLELKALEKRLIDSIKISR